ncbi:hypothetical protein FH609_025250 [Streptomyces sp. 3MP-14]|uniref:Ricin B lectin domain-containing protein n=1 Tax=Streptomyces mimosae TaxID=2586635 RepID=A0A5N6A3H1_9ACTN|nr:MULTISPECIES: beta-L-arabinofuranosidase domain-containing protein [Streptomyces]KAB8161928.1 hypothetical protein FH607_022900 [Streptomyces mimosae]KAB8173626.1 hypothetical protein FH609_025250 [Streptomyces sp. 3MP-14]
MSELPSRRRVLGVAGALSLGLTTASLASAGGARAAAGGARPTATALAVPPAREDLGVLARPFDLGRVTLGPGRARANMERTLEYLRFVDVDRLLYNFRLNHGLSTEGAEQCYGWEAPDFEFRTHSQGHFLTAWTHAFLTTGEEVFRAQARAMVAGLAACQAAPTEFNAGYLSGFPESDFDTVETGQRKGVPYYCLHKTLAGLLDVWRHLGEEQARDVLLAFAGWVDWRTGRLTPEQMQTCLRIEFGGMNAVLTDLYQQTGDERWLTVARRFDHAAVLDPLAAGEDELAGLHANTQIPKIVGCAREFKATGEDRYRQIAVTFWEIVTNDHTYVIGGNSVAEHFRPPGEIARHLTQDTCESCNTYNMLKLTRELFALDPARVALLDYYERALFNQLIGQQDPQDPHGHVCYFTPTNPGGRRTYSNDYHAFTCCQGTGLETQTKLMDSVFFQDDAGLYVSLFVNAELDWTERGVTVAQTTDFPAADTTTLTVTGEPGAWALRLRVPGWSEGATVSVNGEPWDDADTAPGGWAVVDRAWASGDTVTLRLPMRLALAGTPDNAAVQAVTYGPLVLSGAYGDDDLNGQLPVLDTDSLAPADEPLTFTATADGAEVTLIPFLDAHHHNYTVYWDADGRAGTRTGLLLANAASGLVVGVEDASTADGAPALLWTEAGTYDQNWHLDPTDGALALRNGGSGRVLAVAGGSTADDADVVQAGPGGAERRWTVEDLGDGSHLVRNANSGKVLAVRGGSAERGARVVQDADDDSPDNRWWFVPRGEQRLENLNSGLVLGILDMSLENGGPALQWDNTGTADHFWGAERAGDGALLLRNRNSGLVLSVADASTEAGASVVQWQDSGAAHQRWLLRHGRDGYFRVVNAHSGLVLGVQDAATERGARVIQWRDSGTDDHLWRFV